MELCLTPFFLVDVVAYFDINALDGVKERGRAQVAGKRLRLT